MTHRIFVSWAAWVNAAVNACTTVGVSALRASGRLIVTRAVWPTVSTRTSLLMKLGLSGSVAMAPVWCLRERLQLLEGHDCRTRKRDTPSRPVESEFSRRRREE